MSEWKSINEELPEIGQKVDINIYQHDITGKSNKRLTDCFYHKEYGFMTDDCKVVKAFYGRMGYIITHWMPVPEPPKNT